MTLEVRLSGEKDEIQLVLAAIRTVLEVADSERCYPNRKSFGVRLYTQVRLPHTAEADDFATEPTAASVTATAERLRPVTRRVTGTSRQPLAGDVPRALPSG